MWGNARRHAPAGELGRNTGTRGHGAADALVWRWMIDWGEDRGDVSCRQTGDTAAAVLTGHLATRTRL